MIKKNGIRLTRRSKTYTKGLAYAITTYARVQMPPYYDGLHTGIKNARMRCNRTELAVLWYIFKSLSTANMQILFYYPSTLARFFSEYPEFCSRIGGQAAPGWWLYSKTIFLP